MFPVVLEAGDGPWPNGTVAAVKANLRAIPRKGFGYGVLRYLSEDASARAALEGTPAAEVAFNYLGQFDEMWSGLRCFAPARQPMGPLCSPRARRHHRYQLSALVTEGRLRVDLIYSDMLDEARNVEVLLGDYVEALKALARNRRDAPAAPQPSDFDLVALDQRQLDKILGSTGSSRKPPSR